MATMPTVALVLQTKFLVVLRVGVMGTQVLTLLHRAHVLRWWLGVTQG